MIDLPSSRIINRKGDRIGKLVVKEFSHIAPDKGKNAYWFCECDCGNSVCVSSSSLRAQTQRSCGCWGRFVSSQTIKNTHTVGDHLYFIRCGDYVKIGRTTNVHKRLGQLKAMNPYKLTLIRSIEGAGPREHEVHEKFKQYHHIGEWFIYEGIKDQIKEVI